MLTTLTKMAGVALLLLVAALLIAPRAEAQGRFWGTSVADEIDADNDGNTGSTQTSRYRGPFGNAQTQAHTELALWDEVSFCGPTSVLLVYRVFASVATYANGDQLYTDLSDGTACVNFVDGSFTAEINTDVTGGTGKFEGATGWSTLSASGQTVLTDLGVPMQVPDRPALSAFSGTTIDDIVLAE
jgi:hypothetical protein